jgi:hypothetical protein
MIGGFKVNPKILFAVAFSVFFGVSLLGAAESSVYDKFRVELPNRQFKPRPGLDPKLEYQLGRTSSFPVHALVQLYCLPNNDERDFLQKAGLELMPNIDKTVYLADLSKNFKFDAVSDFVRWAGPLFPEDKIEHAFWEIKVRKARNSKEKVRIVVQFYGNVSTNAVEKVLGRHTYTFDGFGRNAFWAAETSYYRLMTLAAEPAVRWIEERTTDALPTSVRK